MMHIVVIKFYGLICQYKLLHILNSYTYISSACIAYFLQVVRQPQGVVIPRPVGQQHQNFYNWSVIFCFVSAFCLCPLTCSIPALILAYFVSDCTLPV